MAEEAPLTSASGVDTTGIVLVAITIIVFLLPLFLYFPPVLPSRTDAILQTHSPLGIEPGKAKKKEEDRRKSSKDPPATSGACVQGLRVFPVKPCKGIEVTQSKVLRSGLQFDGLFNFAQLKSPFPVQLDTPEDEKSKHRWESITQRQFPLLATLEVELFIPDIVKHKGEPVKMSESYLVMRFPWYERGMWGLLGWVAAKLARGRHAVPEKEIVLPVTFPSEKDISDYGYQYEEVTIGRDAVTALNMETELPEELQLYLGVSNKLGLFRINPSKLLEAYKHALTNGDAGSQPASLPDAYSILLLNLGSVKDLQALDRGRLQANITVDGVEPHDEETWKSIRFKPDRLSKRQESTFHVSRRTDRSTMPNAGPDEGLCVQVTPAFEEGSSDVESWLEVGMTIEVLGK